MTRDVVEVTRTAWHAHESQLREHATEAHVLRANLTRVRADAHAALRHAGDVALARAIVAYAALAALVTALACIIPLVS